MRTKPSSAFTLIEVITAMAVILILTGLVIQISGYVTNRGSKARATSEMSLFSAACDSYKADNGAYPQDLKRGGLTSVGVTDELKPKEHFIPTAKEYEDANQFLYKELTGDKVGTNGKDPDGIPDKDEPRYLKEFDAKILKADRDKDNKITKVKYIQDPFGYPYGYSTAAARVEMLYQQDLRTKGNAAKRPGASDMPGFNSSSFDLWSTGGSKPTSQPSDDKKKELEWAKWIKNW
jgi:prepilin-type N-terminal cleavage/methylation domain-containing protein